MSYLKWDAAVPTTSAKQVFDPWKPGFLDIHHLYVGSSVSTFIILPDSTTLLIDAGQVNLEKQRQWWKSLGPPYDKLKALDPVPIASKSPSEWIFDYMTEFWPSSKQRHNRTLDYLLATHFHSDHFGEPNNNNNLSAVSLSGIPWIASQLPIGKLVDRGYPQYDFPKDLRSAGDDNTKHYIDFVDTTIATKQSKISMEQFQVGSKTQIRPLHGQQQEDLVIQVIKNNNLVVQNNDNDEATTTIAQINGTFLDEHGQWNENALSAAFVIQYGDFRYYEGADQEVVREKHGNTILLDTIGPTARAAGAVDVASLNHHGHGVTAEFVDVMDPPVVVLQGWCSDQPKSESVRLLQSPSRQIFATHVFPERLNAMGPELARLFASTWGHVVVRVHPPAADDPQQPQTYEIFVLDGQRQLKSYHGPYTPRKKKH
ncbi:Inherit from NOG: competence protein ComEC [Seminavis robusta]|uniref:Inherit from NOG: competence protein ComEC n=1 Tax=Seminavis robusta TaxID=568900 RepID=A0A9N8E9I8_9STRA|nr:Inherit from NOG: competence protein ComEC [Seminavis robusta]|eukprot:Sro696_g188890.1 Inherit from NOG: competence protein ComEC (428) ;mRNA; r:25406-26762